MEQTSLLVGIEPGTQRKWNLLLEKLRALGSAVVAYSGGVDSGLLSTAAFYALGERMLAVTINSPLEPPKQLESAYALVKQVGFPHRVIYENDLENPSITSNPPNRCYFCKKENLGLIQNIARDEGYAAVLEGSNASDEGDWRPGRKAVAELGAISPLAETGIVKAEIRAIAKALGLVVWDRPSNPCLASRFPYGTHITTQGLKQVGEAEAYLEELGYRQVRVRHHGKMARLEVDPAQIARLVEQRVEITRFIKGLGYNYVTVDLEGFRSGSLNEVLVK